MYESACAARPTVGVLFGIRVGGPIGGWGGAGTTRLQLQYKGDSDHTYTDLANILPCAGILTLPIVSWLLDKKARPPLPLPSVTPLPPPQMRSLTTC